MPHRAPPRRTPFNAIDTSNLRGDVLGGLTAAIVALPLALAFGVASGMGPVAGLYGAVAVGFLAALCGGTPAQISGPTGPMTIVAASVFSQFRDAPELAFTVVMMAGALQILFGALRIGRYVNLMPYPVISGFMSGIGCILIIMQLDPLLGHEQPSNVVNALTVLPANLFRPSLGALAVGLLVVAICFLTPRRIARVVPPPLLGIAAGTLLGMILDGVPVLGATPSGLPSLVLPSIDAALAGAMLSAALVLAALGSIDSLLTSLVADNATRTFHDSDRELRGQGLGNLVAGLVGGLPGAGATIRTLSNIEAGGRTPLSGMIHALLLLLVALGAGSLVAAIPQAALAGVLMKVGVDVVDWSFLRRIRRVPPMEAALMVLVLVLTVATDVILAVGVGVVAASLLFVKSMADVQAESIRGIEPGEATDLYTAEETALFERITARVRVIHLAGLMSFGAANEMARRFAANEGYEVVVLDLVDVPRIDVSAGLALEAIIGRCTERGQRVVIVGMQRSVARVLSRLGALDAVKDTERHETRLDALRALAHADH